MDILRKILGDDIEIEFGHVKKSSYRIISVKLPEILVSRIDSLARKKRLSRSEIIRSAISEALHSVDSIVDVDCPGRKKIVTFKVETVFAKKLDMVGNKSRFIRWALMNYLRRLLGYSPC